MQHPRCSAPQRYKHQTPFELQKFFLSKMTPKMQTNKTRVDSVPMLYYNYGLEVKASI